MTNEQIRQWLEESGYIQSSFSSLCEEVLKLRADLAQARRIAEEAREELRAIIRYAEETAVYWDRDEDHKVGKRLTWMAGSNKGYEPNLDHIHTALATNLPWRKP